MQAYLKICGREVAESVAGKTPHAADDVIKSKVWAHLKLGTGVLLVVFLFQEKDTELDSPGVVRKARGGGRILVQNGC